MLRKVVIKATVVHEQGRSLCEQSSSNLGEGKPTVYVLDGQWRDVPIAKTQGRVRASEDTQLGCVVFETELPNGKGSVRDTRRVIEGGYSLEREIEISLTADYFDKILLNDDLDTAYAGLCQALDARA